MKKIIFEAAVIGSVLLSTAVGAHATSCGATSNTNITSISSNILFANQSQVSVNKTGGNFAFGNIGGVVIVPGAATSTSTQTIVANNNTTNIGVTGGSPTSTVHVVNTGNFVSVCH